MQIHYSEHDDFIAINKGFGFRTHRVSDGQLGLVEYLSEKLQKPLWVVHRLDKETSGVMLFAKSKMAAQNLSSLFENHHIQKIYLLLTDCPTTDKEMVVEGHIDKEDNLFVLKPEQPSNSKTTFRFLKKLGSFNLWQATPETGKPHQIRLHAQKAGIPILGDYDHGGSPFFRLCLHAESLAFEYASKKIELNSETPSLFKSAPENNYETFLQACLEKRTSFYKISESESFRLVHTESEKIRADRFADHLWIYDYTCEGLSETEKTSIRKFSAIQNSKLIIRHMLDRGAGVGGLEKKTIDTSSADENWVANEENLQFVLKTNSGFSPGVFLDQRENRDWVYQNSKNKNVLNLFSYTSGFSVAAALGKASKVTTVDVSAKFLNWGRENFAANQINDKIHEFFAQDCLLFLKGSVKRKRQWDLIICDPPTFGRSKDSVWKIERDLPELAELMLNCLTKNGKILFTCNYEKVNREELLKLFTEKIRGKYKAERLPQLSLDYEHTDDLKNLMKGFLITKI